MIDGDIEVGGYLTGPGQPVFARALNVGAAQARDQDQLNPVGNTTHFGRDYLTPPVWKLEFCIGEGIGPLEALRALAQLQTAWRTAVNPEEPGAVTTLRYAAAGRTRRVYGRPRNFTPDVSRNLADGDVMATAEFVTADPYHYDDLEGELTITLRDNSNFGAVTLPAVWPLMSVPGAGRQGTIIVDGDAPTPVQVTFDGPVVNPALAAGEEWAVQTTTSLAYDRSLTIDARTETVELEDGTPVPGVLSHETYLPGARLEPGIQELRFTGTDATGTSKATIRWRNAYYSF